MKETSRYRRGERDGRAGLNPSSTTSEYMQGWVQGRSVGLTRSLCDYWKSADA